MAGGSGSESMLPMLLMSQASRIDPLYYGQSYVDDINKTLMDSIMASMSGEPQYADESAGEGSSMGQGQRSLPSHDEYNQTMMGAMDYVNSIAAYLEPQHYDYGQDAEGKIKRMERSNPSEEDKKYYQDTQSTNDAWEKLKDWNKKRKTTASSTTDGASLLGGDMQALFASLLGGGQ